MRLDLLGIEKLKVMNSAMIPNEGTYRYRPISRDEFVEVLKLAKEIESYVGYPSTLEHIKEISGVQLELSREVCRFEVGDIAAIVKLKYRVDPGKKRDYKPSAEDFEYGLLYRIA